MLISEYDYDLPEKLIARFPSPCREESRLMAIRRDSTEFTHHRFSELPGFLRPGDLLVLNDTRVFPARLLGHRLPDGGKVEVLLLKNEASARWWAMVRPGKKIHSGDRIVFAPGELEAVVESYGPQGGGERLLRFTWSGDWWEMLEKHGHTPLPPYVLKARKHDAEAQGHVIEQAAWAEPEDPEDRDRYQTVFAGNERASVAAPTAGLHFSDRILEALESMGVKKTFIQLHIGPGTFQPVKTERVEDHPMHEEYIRISRDAADAINAAKAEGRRIIAVGTTVVRALETAALHAEGKAAEFFKNESDANEPADIGAFNDNNLMMASLSIAPASGWTRLLIAPGFNFKMTDALITNFHLPRSTLLLLVSAFAGKDKILEAYREAVRESYRFYSYGDCMIIQ